MLRDIAEASIDDRLNFVEGIFRAMKKRIRKVGKPGQGADAVLDDDQI